MVKSRDGIRSDPLDVREPWLKLRTDLRIVGPALNQWRLVKSKDGIRSDPVDVSEPWF